MDRHGNVRLYARKKIAGKFSKQRIRAQPGSPTFLDEYKAALQRLDASKPGASGVTIKVGTLGWLVAEYEQSFAFLKPAEREQRVRHLILEFVPERADQDRFVLQFPRLPPRSVRPRPCAPNARPQEGQTRRREQSSKVASRHARLGLRRAIEMG